MGKITGGALKRAADMESAIKRWKSDPEDDELTEQVEACVDMAMDGLQMIDEGLYDEYVRRLRSCFWDCGSKGAWTAGVGQSGVVDRPVQVGVVEQLLRVFVDKVVKVAAGKRKAGEISGEQLMDVTQDTTETYLARDLAKAVEQQREPRGVLGNADLKKLAELVDGVKTLQAGGLIGTVPNTTASGMGIPAGLFDEQLGSASVADPFEAYDAGLTSHRAVEITGDGRMLARQRKEPTTADFFHQWSQYIAKYRGSADGDRLEQYVAFLRYLTDLGYEFREVVEFDHRTRHGWKTGGEVVVDKASLGIDFLLRREAKVRSAVPAAVDRPKVPQKCRNFNTKHGCTFTDCKFLHQCSLCQRSGHAAPACPNAPSKRVGS